MRALLNSDMGRVSGALLANASLETIRRMIAPLEPILQASLLAAQILVTLATAIFIGYQIRQKHIELQARRQPKKRRTRKRK